jgi:hypothetical protein
MGADNVVFGGETFGGAYVGGSVPAGPPAYLPRAVDAELRELLAALPAISLDGAKGVGKTSTAAQVARTAFVLDDPAVLEVIGADPARVASASGPVLIDEWQRYPAIWDVVRRAVDNDPSPGRFLLTGSASLQSPGTHSGAGRIVSLRMRPLALAERTLAVPTVSLAALLRGSEQAEGRVEVTGESSVSLESYTDSMLAGGFPGMRASNARAQRAALNSYLARVVDRDVPEAGLRVRNPQLLRRWMTAYAAAVATTTSYDKLRDAASSGEDNKPAKTTTRPYQDALQRIWISDPLPGWAPGRNHLSRLTQAPKHHLADPALAAVLTGMTAGKLLSGGGPGIVIPRDGTYLGALFESLIALSVRVYAQAAEADVYHLRTRAGEHEVDLIVEAADGGVLAIEVKLSATVTDADCKHLLWLRGQLGTGLRDAVVITTGAQAYRRSDGIAVVPAALLGP